MRFSHRGLRTLYETDRSSGLPPDYVPRIRRILADLDAATRPSDLDIPGYRLHPLKGKRTGQWSVRVSRSWRIVFRFDDGEASEVDFLDYH